MSRTKTVMGWSDLVVLCGGNSGSGVWTFSSCLPSVPPSTMMFRLAGMRETLCPYRAEGFVPLVEGIDQVRVFISRKYSSFSATPSSSCPPKTYIRACPRRSGTRHEPCLYRGAGHASPPLKSSSSHVDVSVLYCSSWSVTSVSASRIPFFLSPNIVAGASAWNLKVACPLDCPPKTNRWFSNASALCPNRPAGFSDLGLHADQ
mmetsp:Transcript_2250/g.5623  ORF Transcript_2250/g.5623 Transcript_2250/m.5623 type:complete len:204 (-) Transcript_2250:244-855(-)